MQKMYYLLSFLFLVLSCKEVQKSDPFVSETNTSIKITHAKGFKINTFDTYKTITLTNPWPGAEKEFTYALLSENSIIPATETFDAVVQIPVKKIVVTSTTHIPSLEMLGTSEALVGFPNLNYISSEATRKRIDAGLVTEIGKNEDLNTEVLIDLSPDLVVGFAIDGNNSTFSTLQKTGIPVMYNGDWTETSPLGKAEWIKFFGVLFGKEKEADSIFNAIETDYYKIKKLASQANEKPTVVSGAMYKDIWYLPQGDSWAAQFIADANGDYLWKDSEGTGSLSLNLESVLEKGQHAQYWIGTSQFTSRQQLEETHSVYSKFDAFKNDKLYSSTNKKGATGGLIYYELAPNRPDLVLKDIVKILHPELLPDDDLYFFTHLE